MRKSVLISLGLVLTSMAAVAQADSVSMTVKGAKQGDIKGSATEKGREGTMTCLEFASEVVSPRDAASGQATGKRQHKPMRCVKRVDRASPALFNALVTNEMLSEVTFQLWSASKGGQQSRAYTVALKSAQLTSLRQYLNADGVLMEELQLTFAGITVTWHDGDLVAQDSLRMEK